MPIGSHLNWICKMDQHCTSVIHSHWCHVCTCNCMLHSYSMHTTNASITVCVGCAVNTLYSMFSW